MSGNLIGDQRITFSV